MQETTNNNYVIDNNLIIDDKSTRQTTFHSVTTRTINNFTFNLFISVGCVAKAHCSWRQSHSRYSTPPPVPERREGAEMKGTKRVGGCTRRPY